ncbi:MAG: heavy-metal-associated domain-containing protein [Cytophagales bacterium]|nr:heavy-metal-associated domain-containing protein [Cytophagales bacterium]
MKELKFKTNINCGNCIKSVTPFLNQIDDIEDWKVDTDNPEKILTVLAEDDLDASTVSQTIEKAGFKSTVLA